MSQASYDRGKYDDDNSIKILYIYLQTIYRKFEFQVFQLGVFLSVCINSPEIVSKEICRKSFKSIIYMDIVSLLFRALEDTLEKIKNCRIKNIPCFSQIKKYSYKTVQQIRFVECSTMLYKTLHNPEHPLYTYLPAPIQRRAIRSFSKLLRFACYF